jgi:cobalt/nickel transport system ATP-binding protein
MTAEVQVPAVSVRAVGFAYPDGRVALDGVDLEVLPGERLAVLGPNGAGKSTLVLHLNGILEPQRGQVMIGGRPVVKRNLA